MVWLVPAQGGVERRHADLHWDATECATGFCLSEVADERRPEEGWFTIGSSGSPERNARDFNSLTIDH